MQLEIILSEQQHIVDHQRSGKEGPAAHESFCLIGQAAHTRLIDLYEVACRRGLINVIRNAGLDRRTGNKLPAN